MKRWTTEGFMDVDKMIHFSKKKKKWVGKEIGYAAVKKGIYGIKLFGNYRYGIWMSKHGCKDCFDGDDVIRVKIIPYEVKK